MKYPNEPRHARNREGRYAMTNIVEARCFTCFLPIVDSDDEFCCTGCREGAAQYEERVVYPVTSEQS